MLLRDRFAAGETLITAWSGIPDTLTVELLAAQPFDAVTLDMQHGAHHEDSVARSIQPVLAAGRHALVRIPVGRFDMASRALDFGADAVIAPMINSVDDAKRFAAAMKYPPVGERSWGPTFALGRKGGGSMQTWLETSNRRTMAFAMVETRASLAVLDGILETPGVDGIFVGPSDFSIAWTNGSRLDPQLADMAEAVADIARRTKAAGKTCAIYVADAALVGPLAAQGYQLFATASESQLFTKASAAMLAAAKASLSSQG